MKLLLLLSISALCSADTIYRAVDCSSQECQALFPTLDHGSADLPQPLPEWGADVPTHYIFGGWNADATWGALDICDPDGDCRLWMAHDGAYQPTFVSNWSPMGFSAIINSSGMMLANFSYCAGTTQYVSTLGCVDYEPDSVVEGGIGTFLNINDAGDILQVGGEYALTRLTQQPEPVIALDAVGWVEPVPEPAAVWLLGWALVIIVRRVKCR